jgi:hypothetical protein
MLFQLLSQGSTPVSLLKSESGFEIYTQTPGHQKMTIVTGIVQGYRRRCYLVQIHKLGRVQVLLGSVSTIHQYMTPKFFENL